ncbi:MAG: hypothetical protein IJ733_04015 [Lachnospiraceae bacterium]|nr:hypothetical protein [Lachnospiraceae bacterium]
MTDKASSVLAKLIRTEEGGDGIGKAESRSGGKSSYGGRIWSYAGESSETF